MANRLRFTVKGDPTTVAATAQFTLGSFDYAAIQGFGSISSISQWTIIMRTWVSALHNGGDHGAKVYELSCAAKKNAGAGTGIGAVVAGNGAASGQLLSTGATQPSGTFLWDESGTLFRFRVTPGTTTSTVWMATHDVEILLP